MARRGVNRTRARFRRDVRAQHHQRFPVEERMAQQLTIHARAGSHGHRIGTRDAVAGQNGLLQRIGNHKVIILTRAQQHVGQFRVQCHAEVGGQRPGRGGPDGNRHTCAGFDFHAEAARECHRVDRVEAHVHRGRGLVLVFHLGLGQRRAAVHAPVHGLVAFLEMPVRREFAEGAHDVRLGAEIHREIGIGPVAQHTEADEILALALHLALRVLTALLAKFRGTHLDARFAHFLLDVQFDRQAVAIPAGHVGRIEARQRAGLHDHVLQDLVHGVPDVDLAVRVGRAVMQDEGGCSAARGTDLSVDVLGLPAGQRLGLAGGEVRLHGEAGLRQVQRVLVVSH